MSVIYNKFSGKTEENYEKFLFTHCSNFKGLGGGDSDEKIKQFFKGEYSEKAFASEIVYSFEDFAGQALSSSYTPKESERGYNDFVTTLKSFFYKHQKDGQVVFRNTTSIYH